jgi:hypothetical protein
MLSEKSRSWTGEYLGLPPSLVVHSKETWRMPNLKPRVHLDWQQRAVAGRGVLRAIAGSGGGGGGGGRPLRLFCQRAPDLTARARRQPEARALGFCHCEPRQAGRLRVGGMRPTAACQWQGALRAHWRALAP